MRGMMNLDIFFCDTYALIGIISENPNYSKYTNYILMTSEYNLMELYYILLKDFNKETAEKYFDLWANSSVQIPRKTVKQAMIFRLNNRKYKLSYVDCIGYTFSLQAGAKFLTGDQQFENRPGVEFVK